ncbi:MAG: hypothetical protein E2O95_00955 [Acidobacteria bacterium]|nr:MAG: hypothetical protein E2O95_00955 [Acidobacteriota bacterium]
MDATTRWETEAMRSSGRNRQMPPKPTTKQYSASFSDSRHWVTLREAEEATGIPTNTLRKWVRRAGLPSYLEADGDLAIRMVDLDAVVDRAHELGRTIEPLGHEPEDEPSEQAAEHVDPPEPESAVPVGTMIVPIDAWNKMLNQLGNLHEAGQQLATARERAAKAETEVKFLRERLTEMRTDEPPPSRAPEPVEEEPPAEVPAPTTPPPTTTYWRYLTTGWRARNKSR